MTGSSPPAARSAGIFISLSQLWVSPDAIISEEAGGEAFSRFSL